VIRPDPEDAGTPLQTARALRAAATCVSAGGIATSDLVAALAAAARDLCTGLRALAAAGPAGSLSATARQEIRAASVPAGNAWADLAAACTPAGPAAGPPGGPAARLRSAARDAAACWGQPAGVGGHGEVIEAVAAAAQAMAACAGSLAAAAAGHRASRLSQAGDQLETAAARIGRALARPPSPGRPRPEAAPPGRRQAGPVTPPPVLHGTPPAENPDPGAPGGLLACSIRGLLAGMTRRSRPVACPAPLRAASAARRPARPCRTRNTAICRGSRYPGRWRQAAPALASAPCDPAAWASS
jgi:hypothetical protein